ncbi:MAG: hypothetical protein M1361_01365 [Patescibacteria group bacterium]|nr:hypothetical protein [Patescibacteria group bacterium]MCL5224248.1 hypothetical protein [Patescibacteria group bacterium]
MRKIAVKVYWDDAVIYRHNHGEPFPKPTKMMTRGLLVKNTEDYILIANPISETYNDKLKEFVPKPYVEFKEDNTHFKEATFMQIPKGIITKILHEN